MGIPRVSHCRPHLRVGLALVFVCFLGWAAAATAAVGETGGEGVVHLTAEEAAQHIGETAEVCGRVASAAYLPSVKGAPTFLNFERPYPDHAFTAVIWGTARSRFEVPPERLFDAKSVCVTGRIETYRGKPQIVVEDPEQVRVATQEVGGVSITETEGVLVKALLTFLGHEANYGNGEWDQETVDAAMAFQEQAGIPVTGRPDPATLRALAGEVGGLPESERTMVIRLILFELVRRQE